MDSGSGNAVSTERVKKLSDEIDSLTVKIKDVEEKTMDTCNKNGEDIIRIRSDMNVVKG